VSPQPLLVRDRRALSGLSKTAFPPHRTPLSLPFHRLIFDLYEVSDDELQVIRGA
jgi:hypothetical protein